MKIRSYKGSSLEKIYEVIRKELGPDAVVIPTKTPPRKSLLGPVLGGGGYEVIAVADDASSEKHLMDMLSSPGEPLVPGAGAGQLNEVKDAISRLGEELQQLSTSVSGGRAVDSSLPEYARDWDERFVHQLKAADPAIFRQDKRDRLRAEMAGALHVGSDFAAGKKSPHVIVFVGPTGSGKTTTLAKLAARWALDEKLKTGIITTDTFRVAAVDQVKEYAALMALDVSVAFSANEAASAVERFSGKDVILVDTPGRNHYDQMGLAGIRGILKGMGPVTVLLHVPATLDSRNVSDLLKNFQMLNPDYLVATKVDETRRYGAITTMACETEQPIAFVTDGQRVPQDIHPATVDRLTDILLPEGVCLQDA